LPSLGDLGETGSEAQLVAVYLRCTRNPAV
jgi:hypothetical protein